MAYTATTVSNDAPKRDSVSVPSAGAVHPNHTLENAAEGSLPSGNTSGSPGSLEAPKLEPMCTRDSPLMTVRLGGRRASE